MILRLETNRNVEQELLGLLYEIRELLEQRVLD